MYRDTLYDIMSLIKQRIAGIKFYLLDASTLVDTSPSLTDITDNTSEHTLSFKVSGSLDTSNHIDNVIVGAELFDNQENGIFVSYISSYTIIKNTTLYEVTYMGAYKTGFDNPG